MLGIFLDTETNGLNAQKHRVLELAFKLLNIEDGKEINSLETIVSLTEDEWKESDPISLEINGFTWEEVSQGMSRSALKKELLTIFKNYDLKRGKAVFICQNPSFDRAFFSQLVSPDLQEQLLWPYHWLDLASMYWAINIKNGSQKGGTFPWVIGVSKDKIANALNLPSEEKPHRAMNGVNHLILCYRAIVGFPKAQEAPD